MRQGRDTPSVPPTFAKLLYKRVELPREVLDTVKNLYI